MKIKLRISAWIVLALIAVIAFLVAAFITMFIEADKLRAENIELKWATSPLNDETKEDLKVCQDVVRTAQTLSEDELHPDFRTYTFGSAAQDCLAR